MIENYLSPEIIEKMEENLNSIVNASFNIVSSTQKEILFDTYSVIIRTKKAHEYLNLSLKEQLALMNKNNN
jgi:2-iminoacetate synthase ThiH